MRSRDSGQGGSKPYAPVPNALFWAWDLQSSRSELDADSLRVTYGLLITYTRDDERRPDSRWVWDDVEKLAAIRGIKVETLREHLKQLERLGLIARFPKKHIDKTEKSSAKTIFLKDLPSWWPGREKLKKSGKDKLVKSGTWETLSDEEQDEYISEEERREVDLDDEITDDQTAAANRALAEGIKAES